MTKYGIFYKMEREWIEACYKEWSACHSRHVWRSPRLLKINLIIYDLNLKFKNFVPSLPEYFHRWVINPVEMMLFRQFLFLKSSHFGINTFKLCESGSGPMW
jgi:hypothetical protein